jgi:hypothetical protein
MDSKNLRQNKAEIALIKKNNLFNISLKAVLQIFIRKKA